MRIRSCCGCLFEQVIYAIEQVVLAYGAESDRVLGIPGEVCIACFDFIFCRSLYNILDGVNSK